jgi:hypothetical protein
VVGNSSSVAGSSSGRLAAEPSNFDTGGVDVGGDWYNFSSDEDASSDIDYAAYGFCGFASDDSEDDERVLGCMVWVQTAAQQQQQQQRMEEMLLLLLLALHGTQAAATSNRGKLQMQLLLHGACKAAAAAQMRMALHQKM